jgi:hypothetical protein
MATFNSLIAARQADPTFGNRADGLKVSGELHIAQCQYAATGIESTDDVIRLVRLPSRAMVIPQLCSVRHEAMGTGFSAAVGDDDTTADDDRYSAALDIKAVGQTAFSSAAAGGLVHHVIESQDGAWIQAKLSAVNSPTTGKKLVFLIAYVTQT